MKKVKTVWRKMRSKMTKRWWIMTVYQIITFLLSVAIVYGVVNYAVSKSYRARELTLNTNFTVTAHTGSMDTPDNSIESLEKSIAAGVDVVEFDVRFRPDGTPVMAHDPVNSNEKGVLIEDAFRLLSQEDVDVKINLDVKETSNLTEVQALVKQYGLLERSFFTGVSEKFVPQVREQCPDIPYYLNCAPNRSRLISEKYQQKLLDKLEQTGAIGINCQYMCSNERLATFLHENGYLLSVWTVNHQDEMARALVNGVDNITSKVPDELIDLIDHWHE